MSRVKRGTKARTRRKKVLKLAEGFRGAQSKLFRSAVERVHRALQYAYRDRRVKKRDFRALWITRIGIGARQHGINYSRLMAGLKKAGIALDRKILSDLSVRAPEVFAEVVKTAKAQLS